MRILALLPPVLLAAIIWKLSDTPSLTIAQGGLDTLLRKLAHVFAFGSLATLCVIAVSVYRAVEGVYPQRSRMSALIIVDTALADIDALVAESAEYLSRRLGGTPPLDPTTLPRDAAGALSAIDAWAGTDVANWRQELNRWFDAHAPVRLVPDPELNSLLRRSAKQGTKLACASALPSEPLELTLQHLGCGRAFKAVAAGDGSLDDALSAAQAALGGHDTPLVRTRAELLSALGA